MVLLALASALFYGLSDFVGGLLSRHAPVWQVAFAAQVSSTVCLGLVAPAFGGHVGGAALVWGALSGVGSGVGTAFLFRGLAAGRMSVVAPLSAVGAAVVPVLVSVVLGQRPSALAWLGIVAALPAIGLVSAGEDAGPAGGQEGVARAAVVDGLLAGGGFGFLFIALGQVPEGSGLLPTAAGQVVSALVVVVLASVLGQAWWPRDRRAARAVLTGPLGAGATALYQFAVQSGSLAIAAVLSSLYPAFTVLLAVLVLRERLARVQTVGLALAATSVTLIALS